MSEPSDAGRIEALMAEASAVESHLNDMSDMTYCEPEALVAYQEIIASLRDIALRAVRERDEALKAISARDEKPGVELLRTQAHAAIRGGWHARVADDVDGLADLANRALTERDDWIKAYLAVTDDKERLIRRIDALKSGGGEETT